MSCGRARWVLVLWLPLLAVAQEEEPFFAPGTQPNTLATPLLETEICLFCHRAVDPPSTVAPGDTWRGSMMANAWRDPVFRAAFTIANQDLDALGVEDGGSFCLRCHLPGAWVSGRSLPGDGSALLEGDRAYGVECAFCHRHEAGADRDPAGPLVGNGQFYVFDEPVQLGPRAADDVEARHQVEDRAFFRDGRFCGPCHSVSNPALPWRDPNPPHEPLGGPAPEQSTFQEWARSAYPGEGETCQSCHMPRERGRSAIDPAREREDVARHDLAGVNVWMTHVLERLYPAEAADYQYTRARILEVLSTAARIEIRGLPEEVDGDAALAFDVRVTNLSGHKLPSGYPDGRRMWLEVEARVDDAEAFFHSGAYDLAEAELHHDAQLRDYHMEPGIAGQGHSLHLVLNDTVLVDTRIPPRGFDPTPDLLPIGRDYTDGAGGWRHWDDAPYAAGVPDAASGVVVVTARLWSQTMTREFVEWLRDNNFTDRAGEELHQLWEETERAPPVLVAEGIARARIAGTPCREERCNGVDDDCDGEVDEDQGDLVCGFGGCGRRQPACVDGQRVQCVPGEPEPEICNGVDDDCDGDTDEGLDGTLRCGVGACARAVPECADEVPGECVPGAPSEEICNGVDDDCDGHVDELGFLTCGRGGCERSVPRCDEGFPGLCVPGAPQREVCNGVDDDCDGVVDDELDCPDAGLPPPDAALPPPDMAPPAPDMAPPTPDAAAPRADMAPPTPDAAELDGAPPPPDMAPPAPDAATPPDGATPRADGADLGAPDSTPGADGAPAPDGTPRTDAVSTTGPPPDAARPVDSAPGDAGPRPEDAAEADARAVGPPDGPEGCTCRQARDRPAPALLLLVFAVRHRRRR